MRVTSKQTVYKDAQVDVPYCASSYLMHRTLCDNDKCFSKAYPPRLYPGRGECDQIYAGEDLIESMRSQIREVTADGKAALALSGGIDSAVMARFMPEGSKAYTFKCVVPGMEVTDETGRAARYAEACGLDHEIIEVYWDDNLKYAKELMKHKGAPIHSIEVQIHKAALRAKEDGFERIIFGESADLNFGGLSGLLSKEWLYGDYVERYAYVMPYRVLKKPVLVMDPFLAHCREDGTFDVREHHRDEFFREAMGSYANAVELAGIDLVTPYANTWMASDMDYQRIRNGENKYIIREAFESLYPGFEQPDKLPMPRPMDEWMAGWDGPTRKEFIPNCTQGMSGDQKWLVWALERFLDTIDDVGDSKVE